MVPWNSVWQQARHRDEDEERNDDDSEWPDLSKFTIADSTPLPTMNVGPSLTGAFSGNVANLPNGIHTDANSPLRLTRTFGSQFAQSSKGQGPLSSTPSTSTYTHTTPYPDQQTENSATPTTITSDDAASPSSTAFGDPNKNKSASQQGPADRTPVYAAAAIILVVVIAAIGIFIFICMKKRKKQQQIAATQAKVNEMKQTRQTRVSAYMAPAPPITREPSYTAPPRHPPPASPQPVILGPISAGANGNYFTGIDTSDAVSVRNERTGLGDPFADGSSLNEEPPPPYRPRSIPALSRDTSLRFSHTATAPHPMSSQTHLIDDRGMPLQSPFDDPRDDNGDDDAVSDLSGHAMRRDGYDMSVVSDLSYQQDPVVNRSSV
ncbi:hypothetical protein CC80DRAFT_115304 [Byssothecium circinans]|uniref:Uncharacterized protein n=1 Tax=Byssothecium circinans TaxID=147558 RepID=A0A6A5TPY8_9PLEO|nr:hypothetical protein CC80DRAFT_115304 [Byssothecium circinans]